MKVSKVFNKNTEMHGVEVETPTGFINHMWFDEEPKLDDSEWLDYIHEETRFREEMWIQSGKFKPTGVVIADQEKQVEEDSPST